MENCLNIIIAEGEIKATTQQVLEDSQPVRTTGFKGICSGRLRGD